MVAGTCCFIIALSLMSLCQEGYGRVGVSRNGRGSGIQATRLRWEGSLRPSQKTSSYLVLWIVAPGVNTCKLLASHTAAPSRVRHVVAGGGDIETVLLKTNVP
jgi:hypothetical protein